MVGPVLVDLHSVPGQPATAAVGVSVAAAIKAGSVGSNTSLAPDDVGAGLGGAVSGAVDGGAGGAVKRKFSSVAPEK